MMVLVIIGLMSSAVVISLPKDPPATRQMAEALTRDLNNAAQDSLLSGEPFALGLSDAGYSFLAHDGADWAPVTSGEWADKLSAKLKKDGESIKLTDTALPFVLFEPTGTSTVFELTLSNFDGRYTISSQGDGRVLLETGS